MGFSKVGSKSQTTGVPDVIENFDYGNIEDIMLEDTVTFNLAEFKAAILNAIEENHRLIAALALHFVQNGSARDQMTRGIKVRIGGTEYGFSAIRTAVEKVASEQKSGLSTVVSVNAGKIFQRAMAKECWMVWLAFVRSHTLETVKNANKIASKLNLTERSDIIMSTQFFADCLSMTIADKKRYLRIMAAYLQRIRSGHNKVDTLGKPVNKEEIFMSLVQRLAISQPQSGFLDNETASSIWKSPNLSTSDKADGGSILVGDTTLGSITVAENDPIPDAPEGEEAEGEDEAAEDPGQ